MPVNNKKRVNASRSQEYPRSRRRLREALGCERPISIGGEDAYGIYRPIETFDMFFATKTPEDLAQRDQQQQVTQEEPRNKRQRVR
jgi:hypothetical protein